MTHNHCHHVFKFCSDCDLVYCSSCHREWGGHRHNNSYPYWPVLPWYTGTAGGTDPTYTFPNTTSGFSQITTDTVTDADPTVTTIWSGDSGTTVDADAIHSHG